jgi:phage terminase large subunit-like protein
MRDVRPQGVVGELKVEFVRLLREEGLSIEKACARIRRGRTTVDRWRHADPDFERAIRGEKSRRVRSRSGELRPDPSVTESSQYELWLSQIRAYYDEFVDPDDPSSWLDPSREHHPLLPPDDRDPSRPDVPARTPEEYGALACSLTERYESSPRDLLHALRSLCRRDLVFLLSEVLSTRDWVHPENSTLKLFLHPWVIDRLRDFQYGPQDAIYILPRGHIKSTGLTFGEAIRTLLDVPDATLKVFSVTSDLAQTFVEMQMTELESNELLPLLFPDRLFMNPRSESRRWSSKAGYFVRRTRVFRDPSVQAWGLVDSSHTGGRYTHAFYDDCVNEKSVTNADQIEKANRRWEMSLNLAVPGAVRKYAGTFYAAGDSYHHMIGRGVELHLHSCYELDRSKTRMDSNGIPKRLVVDRERPVLFSKPYLERQEELMGTGTFAVQMLGSPSSYEVTEFKEEWLRFYDTEPSKLEGPVVICVDPANRRGTNKHSRTAMTVCKLQGDQRFYLVDGVLDRLNLAERTDMLFELVERWTSSVHGTPEVRYEQVGYASDVDHIQMEQERRGFLFDIKPVKAVLQKEKRVEWLIPVIRAGRLALPRSGIPYVMRETGQLIDVVQWFVENEMLPFPNAPHLDFIDALSRLMDPDCENTFPAPRRKPLDEYRSELYKKKRRTNLSWLSS